MLSSTAGWHYRRTSQCRSVGPGAINFDNYGRSSCPWRLKLQEPQLRHLYPVGWTIVIRCSTVCRTLYCTSCSLCTECHCTTDHWRRRRDHITPVLRKLHWLPMRERVGFKVACLVHQSLSRQAPVYLAEDCCLVSNSTWGPLRSANITTCVVPQTLSSYGDRSFAAAGPRLYNSLQSTCAIYRHHLWTVQATAQGPAVSRSMNKALWPFYMRHLEKHLLTYLCGQRLNCRRSVCIACASTAQARGDDAVVITSLFHCHRWMHEYCQHEFWLLAGRSSLRKTRQGRI